MFPGAGAPRVARELGELLVGQDARHPHPLWLRLLAAVSGTGAPAGAGISYNAISGLETALWDLNGKRLGEPLARLLGGAFRETVDVYADLHAGGQLESLDSTMRYRRPFWLSPSGQTEPGPFYWEAEETEVATADLMIERAKTAVVTGYRH